jgi:hypothetical protein
MKTQKYNLTKRVIEELAIPNRRTYYRDAQVRGLHLDVTPSGVKSFYVRRTANGRSDRLFIGRFPDISVEQARSKAMSFHADLSVGHSQVEESRNRKTELSLSELFELYIERHISKSRKTAHIMRQDFESLFSHWKDRKLSAITRESVELLHAQIGKERGKYRANRAI